MYVSVDRPLLSKILAVFALTGAASIRHCLDARGSGCIADRNLLVGPDQILSSDEPDLAQHALGWVLEALFIYRDKLGLEAFN